MTRDDDFTAFMAARWATLVRSAVLLGCGPADAEDVVQTTLSRCYAKWGRVSRADNVDAYVYRMLVNALTDGKRRSWSAEHATADVPGRAEPDDVTIEVDIGDAIDRALSGLSPGQRAVLVLRFFAHVGEQETALALGVAPGTVKSRTSRALAQLATDRHLTDFADGTNP